MTNQPQEQSVLQVSSSPHIFSNESIAKIMWTVIAALVPAVIFSVYHFGVAALMVLTLGVVSAVGFEYLVFKLRGKEVRIYDGSAVLTGLLLAMSLPSTVPWYLPIFGSFMGIVVAKHSMGGLGYNIFNPAHIGRAALLASWPVAMTKWTSLSGAVDAVASATPLNVLKQQGYAKLVALFGSQYEMYRSMFLGLRNGSLGETSVLLLLLGGLYLIYRGYVNWVVPATMISTVALLTWFFGPFGLMTGDPLFHIMAGGLIIGAFFMATDMVTIPITTNGQILFALGAGALIVLIRQLGGYPEGVCYSILIMNSVTPLIDRFLTPVKFGTRRS